MAQLGEKLECDDCGIKVYDLGRAEAPCPRCGRDLKSSGPKRRVDEATPRAARPPAPAPAPEPDLEEPPEEAPADADDLDDDLGADDEIEIEDADEPEEAEEAEADDDE